MKACKIFSIAAVAALLLAPATAFAKTNLSFSLNLFDCLAPMMVPAPVIVAPPPPRVVYYVPCRPCYKPRVVVKEYHYYHQAPVESVEEINPSPYYFHPPQPR